MAFESLTGNVVSDVVITLVVGGSMAAVITFIGNNWIKSRELKVEMSKQKRSSISSMLPLYSQLGTYYNAIASRFYHVLHNNEPDCLQTFYYVCVFISLCRRLEQNGGFALDDIDAEVILEIFRQDALSLFSSNFQRMYLSKITSLVERENKLVPYDMFCKDCELSVGNRELFNEFRYKLLYEFDQDYLANLSNEGSWFLQLIYFEMNQTFRDWYGGNMQGLKSLDEELIKFLYEDYASYNFYKDLSTPEKSQFDEHFRQYYNRIYLLERARERAILFRRL